MAVLSFLVASCLSVQSVFSAGLRTTPCVQFHHGCCCSGSVLVSAPLPFLLLTQCVSDSVGSAPRSCTLAAPVDFKAQSFALVLARFALVADLSRPPRRPIFSNDCSSAVFFLALLLPLGQLAACSAFRTRLFARVHVEAVLQSHSPSFRLFVVETILCLLPSPSFLPLAATADLFDVARVLILLCPKSVDFFCCPAVRFLQGCQSSCFFSSLCRTPVRSRCSPHGKCVHEIFLIFPMLLV